MNAPSRDSRRSSIALIGMRCCGKTSVGRALASLRGMDLVDTDLLICEATGRSIAQIFALEGEAGFRAHEREAVRRALELTPAVISVGGGAVLDARNVDALRKVSTIVWLTAPAEVLWRRRKGDATTVDSRPSLTARPGLDEVTHLLAKRQSYYEAAADCTVDASTKTPGAIADEIVAKLA